MDSKRKHNFTATIITVITIGIASGSALAGGLLGVEFDQVTFGSSTKIDNPHWPLLPDGMTTTFIYLGETEDGCVFDKVVADPAVTKMDFAGDFAGITAQVVVDREWELEMECDAVLDQLDMNVAWEPDAEELGEWTDDWYAQDDFKNIWYMGEASRDFGEVEIDDVEVTCPSVDEVPLGTLRGDWPGLGFSDEFYLECTGGSWEAGQPGQEEGEVIGEPGIVVPSDTPFGDGTGEPLTSGTYWMQEVAENAEDMAKVLRLSARLSVEDDDYDSCRKVKEWNPIEHGESVEHKWYCQDGPGLVLIEGIGGGPTEIEVLVLSTP